MSNDNEDQMTGAYASILLNLWVEIIDLREKFRANYILGSPDLELSYAYISKLTSLWLELLPKVEGRAELHELEDEFKKFEVYYYDPAQLSHKENSDDIFKMENILRRVIEKLGVTETY